MRRVLGRQSRSGGGRSIWSTFYVLLRGACPIIGHYGKAGQGAGKSFDSGKELDAATAGFLLPDTSIRPTPARGLAGHFTWARQAGMVAKWQGGEYKLDAGHRRQAGNLEERIQAAYERGEHTRGVAAGYGQGRERPSASHAEAGPSWGIGFGVQPQRPEPGRDRGYERN